MSNARLAGLGLPPVALAAVDYPHPIGKSAWRAHVRRVGRARPRPIAARHAALAADVVGELAARLDVATIGLYSPLGTETDTRPLANRLLADGRSLVYPRLRGDDVTIEMCVCDGPSHLAARPRSRLLEPTGPAVEPGAIDLLIVPAMAVDARLARLGRGGGSYDRYLPLLPDTTVQIALIAADCVIPWGPVERHDAELDAVVTEAGLYVAAEKDTAGE